MTALLSADVCRLLCVHSIALLGPMLSDEAKQTSYWKAWVAHVRVLEMALRDHYSLGDVTCLDDLILQHHSLFLKVPLSAACHPAHLAALAATADPAVAALVDSTPVLHVVFVRVLHVLHVVFLRVLHRSQSTTACGSQSTTSRHICRWIFCALDR